MTTTDHAPCTIRPVIERYVASIYHAHAHPERYVAVRSSLGDWDVWRGSAFVAAFDSHAAAIAYADRMARLGK